MMNNNKFPMNMKKRKKIKRKKAVENSILKLNDKESYDFLKNWYLMMKTEANGF